MKDVFILDLSGVLPSLSHARTFILMPVNNNKSYTPALTNFFCSLGVLQQPSFVHYFATLKALSGTPTVKACESAWNIFVRLGDMLTTATQNELDLWKAKYLRAVYLLLCTLDSRVMLCFLTKNYTGSQVKIISL